MAAVGSLLSELAQRFVSLHTRKEDLFWITKMGLSDDTGGARKEMSEAEIALNRFLQDPSRVAQLRSVAEQSDATGPEQRILRGWLDMFSANTVESAEGRKLSEEIVEREGELERKRGAMALGYIDPDSGARVPASSVRLALMMRTETDERKRKAAYEGLRSIEQFVLDAGFLDIVRKRNALGRLLGYEDYYAWRVAVVERMTKARLFGMLDDLASRTMEKSRRELGTFAEKHGPSALEPWNFGFLQAGRITRELDPYFGFGVALERWGRSFHAMNVRFRGATLTLDLVDRPGKYENGFMHGPGLAYFEGATWHPARINFTANAVAGQPGSGLRATETLFHEGGHAAHFSNILADAPCFSHEFAPTSVAYAETQSMFMDSLLGDADWRARYACDASGTSVPIDLIAQSIREEKPFQAWNVRAMLTVPFAERAIYEIPDNELTNDRVLEVLRTIERTLQGLTAGTRPVLAVPHLLAGESSAYYHAYILAEMAVHQTRRHFLAEDGHLVDNSRIGPALAEHCWAPGNAVPFEHTLRGLTGAPLSADALVDECNMSTDDAVAQARASIARLSSIPPQQGPVELDARIRVVHGRETIASTEHASFEEACRAFERRINEMERVAKASTPS